MNNLGLIKNLYFLREKYLRRVTPLYNQSSNGFTLIEMLITVFMIGILSAIVAPSWLSFIDARRLNTAQDQVYRAIREAQSNSKRDKAAWQASFKEEDGVVQLAIHPASSTPVWNKLGQTIRIDTTKTTLPLIAVGSNTSKALFNYKGCPVTENDAECGQPPVTAIPVKITLTGNNSGQIRRCIIISTLLGAMRTAKDSACS